MAAAALVSAAAAGGGGDPPPPVLRRTMTIAISELSVTATITPDGRLAESFTVPGGRCLPGSKATVATAAVEVLAYDQTVVQQKVPTSPPATGWLGDVQVVWATLEETTVGGAPALVATGRVQGLGTRATPAQSTLHKNTDMMGNDYRHFVLNSTGAPAAACQSACEAEVNGTASTPPCRAWAWACPGMQGPDPVCWLKTAPARTSRDCATSGTVTPAAPARPGWSATLTKTIRIVPRGSSAAVVEVSHVVGCDAAAAAPACALVSLEDRYAATLGKRPSEWGPNQRPDVAYSPSIKKGPEDVTAHWNFKSPAVLLQQGPLVAAIVADLPPGSVAKAEMLAHPTMLDLSNPTNGSDAATLSYGLSQSVLTSHSVYSRDTTRQIEIPRGQRAVLKYLLFIGAGARDAHAGGDLRALSSLLWDRMGRAALLSSPHQQSNVINPGLGLQLFDTWRAHAWHSTAQDNFFEFPCTAGAALGINCSSIATGRSKWANQAPSDRDMWLNAWFQTLRQSLAMHRYGHVTGNNTLQQQAVGTLVLALSAPQHQGAFPSVFWLEQDGSEHWAADSGWAGLCNEVEGAPANCSGFYHLYDMVWSSYWMLRWREEPSLPLALVGKIDGFVEQVARFVTRKQQQAAEPVPPEPPNGLNGGGSLLGSIPAWFDGVTLEPRPEMRFNSETAAAALLLAEAHAAGLGNGTAGFLAAAEDAMDFVEREVVPQMRWFDFETFVSCATKPFGFFDGHTNQHPQNGMGMIQAARAELRLYQLTGNASRMEWGERILGRLSLLQAVWSHPALTPVLSGGFTSQNTDAEWSDNRQQLAAVAYLEFYFAVQPRNPEYLERGVAALRSTFPIAPYENWAHTGGGAQGDIPGAISSAVHWGECSAVASVEFTRALIQDLYVWVGKQGADAHGVCVNGCSLDALNVSSATVALNVSSPFGWSSGHESGHFVAVVDGATGPMRIVLNGQHCGTFSAAALKAGAALPARWLNRTA